MNLLDYYIHLPTGLFLLRIPVYFRAAKYLCRMASNEDKYSLPVEQNNSDQGSSVSTDLQEEYEELLRYTIVTPNIESSASQLSHPKGEAPDTRIPATTDNILHSQAGNTSVVRETAMEGGKGCDLHISSHSNADDAHEIIMGDCFVSDENLQRMENVLDLWSSGLKTNIISELSKWRLNFIDWHRMQMKKEKEKHAAHIKQLCSQISDLKELQKTFEISIGRKDEVISSLSHAISKQKERIELMRTFFYWRIGHVKSRQDVYEGKLADQYFQRTLLKKVWKGWRSVVQRQWKEVVERACQARAEEVCIQISNDYEAKVAMLSGALENAKAEIQRMQQEKEHFEDSMKKAFMRGVCALNLEAMTIFQNRNDAGTDFTNNKKEEYGPGVPGREHSAHLEPAAFGQLLPSPPAGPAGAASASAAPSATSVTVTSVAASAPSGSALGPAPPAAPGEAYVPRVVTSAQQRAGRTITARITGRCDFASKNRINSSLAIMGVSPPMSSVVVEKHHPVTVQTIPQATAAKYPRAIHPESGTSASRSLGTRSSHTQSLTSIQSIKVVD
ncbi:PREDICTED: centrosomal protein POC5 isoform X3 [Chinchilla lanigera]|uniref:centrosomal protein POC5 isoform X3 n=1 Tax=Chinchilla lanigera TaxID=34839 RepID=UPI000697316D|nr:PREDICTED: centrosomal protein POC5 isoform X3 [Chinchilla lanigera]